LWCRHKASGLCNDLDDLRQRRRANVTTRPPSWASRSTTWRVLALIRLTLADAWDEEHHSLHTAASSRRRRRRLPRHPAPGPRGKPHRPTGASAFAFRPGRFSSLLWRPRVISRPGGARCAARPASGRRHRGRSGPRSRPLMLGSAGRGRVEGWLSGEGRWEGELVARAT
jgi:hypothetical protein